MQCFVFSRLNSGCQIISGSTTNCSVCLYHVCAQLGPRAQTEDSPLCLPASEAGTDVYDNRHSLRHPCPHEESGRLGEGSVGPSSTGLALSGPPLKDILTPRGCPDLAGGQAGPWWGLMGEDATGLSREGLISVMRPYLWGRNHNISADIWLDTAVSCSRTGVGMRGHGPVPEFPPELRLKMAPLQGLPAPTMLPGAGSRHCCRVN